MDLQDSFLSIFPQDIVIKIFSLLPLKSLHRFKWVSKSWLYIITHSILQESTPTIGYFFQYHPFTIKYFKVNPTDKINVDSTLFFLPLHEDITILDCCNGLLLVSARDHEWHYVHYVCNPVTKSWVILPDHPEAGFTPSILGFKPYSSPHFTVLSIDQHRGNGWSIYSSKAKKWSKKHMFDRDEVLPPNRNKIDFSIWDGDIYIVRRKIENVKVKRICLETARVRLAEGEEEPIRFPQTAAWMIRYINPNIKPKTYIGKLGGELCFAQLHGLGIVVWSLGRGRMEWMVKHASNIGDTWYLDPDPIMGRSILGFHPNSEIVFILHDGIVYSYDLNKMALEEVYKLGVRHAEAFLFSPCMFEVFEG